MKTLDQYLSKIRLDPLKLSAIGGLGALAFGMRIYNDCRLKNIPAPNPVILEDINSDGIEDRIEQKVITFYDPHSIIQYKLEDHINYGVRTEDGKLVFIPPKEFDRYKSK